MIPSLEYLRTAHKEFKAYMAVTELRAKGENKIYSITYPELKRTLEIEFENSFPYSILGWSDAFKSGYGAKAKTLTSKGVKMKELKGPYWRQNGIEDEQLRTELGL